MRFYSGDHSGKMNHHDIALVENNELAGAAKGMGACSACPCAVNHIAITLPNREAWLRHLEYLQGKGVKFNRRVEHGMTHSLYINDPTVTASNCCTNCRARCGKATSTPP